MSYEDLKYSRNFESKQRRKIRKIAEEILKLFNKYSKSPFQIPNLLRQLSEEKSFFDLTKSISESFLYSCMYWHKRAFRRNFFNQSHDIFKNFEGSDNLQHFMYHQIYKRASLFRNVPVYLAEHLVPVINEKAVQGMTSEQISKDIREKLPDLLEWNVRLIARTELSKALTNITEFKCQQGNINVYQWKASGGGNGDGRTRYSHKKMSDVLVFWKEPPAPEELFPSFTKKGMKIKSTLGHYHAGCCPNCRCVAMPVVSISDIEFPARIYLNGRIRRINKRDFFKLISKGTDKENQETKNFVSKNIKNNEILKKSIKERKEIEKNSVKEYFLNPNKNFENYEIRRSYIDTTSFDRDCEEIFFDNKTFCDEAKKLAKKIFEHREKTNELDKEELYIMDSKGDIRGEIDLNNLKSHEAEFTQSQLDAIEDIKKENLPFVAIHNHPNNTPPSLYDFNHIFKHRYNFGLIFCHSGAIYKYYRPDSEIDIDSKQEEIEDKINNKFWELFNREEAYIQIYKEYGLKFERVYKNS